MALISINNIALTKGETSDIFEIFSKDSLKDYQAHFRITDSSRKELFKKRLQPTAEIKNSDGIFNDALFYELSGKTYDLIDGISEWNNRDKQFKGKIVLTNMVRDELRETIKFEGLVTQDGDVVISSPTPPASDETSTSNPTIDDGADKTNGYTWFNTTTSELFTWDGSLWNGNKGTKVSIDGVQTNPIQQISTVDANVSSYPAKNVEVTLNFVSSDKEYSRQTKAVSDENGIFKGEIFLGDTVRQERGFGFVFSIPSTITDGLNSGRYVVTVVCEKFDDMGNCVFSKEIIQTNLDINERK